ncbi:MAG TPA: Maf family protein [Polyangiales bacterium]|nr:Maf family protein [Polyangiales bacterium]
MQQKPLVLASASPRRKQILEQLGLTFRVIPSGFDETLLEGETPSVHVERLARGKAAEIVARLAAAGEAPCVLAADTIVVLDAEILGKPRDDGDAVRMLLGLSGRAHRVSTGVALFVPGAEPVSAVFESEVRFRELTRASATAYVASGEGRDKAGSYAIQGLGAGLVREIVGSYTNVVGLPAAETLDLLLGAGVLGAWP